MQIANPIYDTVFKYMMNDNKVAKLLLSAIIGEKIVELDFSQTEYTLNQNIPQKKRNRTLEQITVCRFDFAAKIEIPNGYKTIIIELQKAKLATDIMRFRRYLGTMYQDKKNSSDKKQQKARQIYCIYFLNYEIGLADVPVIKVDYTATDATTGETLPTNSEFLEGLTHKSWVIQVRQLKEKRRNDLENLLAVFDQSYSTDNKHILNIDDTHYPEAYRIIFRKLQEACASEKVRKEMQLEDDYLSELLDREELIAKQEEALVKQAEELAQQDEVIAKQAEENTQLKEQIAELKRLLGE